jgi:hypothetical protein
MFSKILSFATIWESTQALRTLDLTQEAEEPSALEQTNGSEGAAFDGSFKKKKKFFSCR